LSVFAYLNTETNESKDNFLQAAHVCLVCPECREGHAFYDGTDAAKMDLL